MNPPPRLSGYFLRIIEEGDNARLYQLVPPEGTEMQSVRLAFLHPDQKIASIVIYGDYCPDRNGVVSATGYGLEWFLAAGGDDYLLSKFLTTSLQWDAVVSYIDGRVEDEINDGEEESTWKDLRERVSDGDFSYDGEDADRLYEAVAEIDSEAYEGCTDYNQRDKELLLAVRDTFRRLYWEVETQRDLEKMGGASSKAETAKTPPWWKRALTWLLAPRPGYGGKLSGSGRPSAPLPTPPRTMEPPRKPRSPQ